MDMWLYVSHIMVQLLYLYMYDCIYLVDHLAIWVTNCHIHIPTYDFGPVVVIWTCGYMCVIVWFGCCIYIIMTAFISLVVWLYG